MANNFKHWGEKLGRGAPECRTNLDALDVGADALVIAKVDSRLYVRSLMGNGFDAGTYSDDDGNRVTTYAPVTDADGNVHKHLARAFDCDTRFDIVHANGEDFPYGYKLIVRTA